jgi:hypothetical protein
MLHNAKTVIQPIKISVPQQTSMATSCPIKFHTAAKPDVKRKSDNDAQNKNTEKYEAYTK